MPSPNAASANRATSASIQLSAPMSMTFSDTSVATMTADRDQPGDERDLVAAAVDRVQRRDAAVGQVGERLLAGDAGAEFLVDAHVVGQLLGR